MITGRSITMWVTSYRGWVVRVMAGCGALFWLVGTLSVGLGNFADQWTKPHCPSGQAQHTQQSQHHCVWHCDGIDEQATGGQGGASSNLDSGNIRNEFVSIPYADLAYAQIAPRGPPALSV